MIRAAIILGTIITPVTLSFLCGFNRGHWAWLPVIGAFVLPCYLRAWRDEFVAARAHPLSDGLLSYLVCTAAAASLYVLGHAASVLW